MDSIQIDFHSHILPGIDDGSKDPKMSADMLKMLYNQGIRRSIMTPHFYGRRHSPEDFYEIRQEAYERLMNVYDPDCMPKLCLGAEIAITPHSADWDISKLKIEGTDIILLEMPDMYEDWIDSVIYEYSHMGYKIMIAHLDRVIEMYRKDGYRRIMNDRNIIYQINNESLGSHKIKKILACSDKDRMNFVLGSDAHNLNNRAPNFDTAVKCLKKGILSEGFCGNVIRNQNRIIDSYWKDI